MNLLINFLAGVGTSLIAGLILLWVGPQFSSRMREVLLCVLMRFLDVDVDKVFATQRSAASDVQYEIERASFVKIMTGRGNELLRPTFRSVFDDSKVVCVLLPDPEASPNPVDWIDDRLGEVSTMETTLSEEVLRNQIRGNIEYLGENLRSNMEVRLYCCPHFGRVIVTPRAAFLTTYRANTHGCDSPVIKYRAGGDTYAFLNRLFEKVSKGSRPAFDPPTRAVSPGGQ